MIVFDETTNTVINIFWNFKGVSSNVSRYCYQLINNTLTELRSFTSPLDYMDLDVRLDLIRKFKSKIFVLKYFMRLFLILSTIAFFMWLIACLHRHFFMEGGRGANLPIFEFQMLAAMPVLSCCNCIVEKY